ncbi:hypothetical protein H0X09_01680 [Candidatus Saccharibacteria bacterium]|nr:hypothetical protein [Candidatus Saccharibacteria bacterium]
MNKLFIKRVIFSAAGLALLATGGLVLSGGGSAYAQDTDNEVGQPKTAEQRKAKLDANKLRVCEKREASINKIMQRIATRGEKQIGVFNKISERTQAFYVKKERTLSNYDALVADVNAKKVAAETALAEIKATIVDFKCDGTDPHGKSQLFKDNLKKEIAALKDYKTAVKNLIRGVKSANSSSTKEESQ